MVLSHHGNKNMSTKADQEAHETTLLILDYSLQELDRVNADNQGLAGALVRCIGRIEHLTKRNAVLRDFVKGMVR